MQNQSVHVHDELFISNEWDETLLYPIIINAVASTYEIKAV